MSTLSPLQIPVGNVNAQTVGYTAVAGDSGKLITMNGSSLTLTLPSASPSTNWFVWIKNLASTTLTVSPNGLQLDGSSSNVTLLQYQAMLVHTDGTNYFSVTAAPLVSPTFTGTITVGTLAATTINGAALSGTFTGTPTFSGNVAFTGTPTFSNALALGSSTATTQSVGTSNADIATTAFVAANFTGCTSGCNYVLTTADQQSGPGSPGNTLSNANQGQYIQFWNNANRTVGNACVQVTTVSSGGHFDVGIYSVSGTTGTRLWHTGSLSTTSTGAQCVTPTAYTMTAGTNYLIAWCADNTTAIIEAIASAPVISAAGPAHTAGVDATDTCATGVLPSSITTTNISNTSTHLAEPYVYVNN